MKTVTIRLKSDAAEPTPLCVFEAAAAAEAATGPVLIDPRLLQHIVGGSPKGGWCAVAEQTAAPLSDD